MAANIRNGNTRMVCTRAAVAFSAWCDAHGITDLRQVQPVHVAACIKDLQIAAPSERSELGGTMR